jgi:hypothetical protein
MPSSRSFSWIYHVSIWVYTAGYCVYLTVVAAKAWPHMTWWDWSVYVSWESVYALAWPVLLLLPAN